MRLRDTEVHDGLELPGDFLEMWLLDVDWQDSDNTTLAQAADIDVADFDVHALRGLRAWLGRLLSPARHRRDSDGA